MINVIGIGYIGLPTALMFAANGIEVVGTDSNRKIVEDLQNNIVNIKEKGLDLLFLKAISKNIRFTNFCEKADIYIISVPTPYDRISKKIDVGYIIEAVEQILKVSPKGAIMVVESTVSPGTIDKYLRPLVQKNGFIIGEDIHLAHAPERIIPGNMIAELQNNPRTIGVDNADIGEKIKKLYSCFCKGEIVVTDIKTAEMTKVVENAYRDVNIAFANELVKICHNGSMNVYEIIKISNMHPRVNILDPGPGVGGHCISVDPWFLVGDYPGLANIILAARKINDSMPEFVLERVYNIMEHHNIKDISKIGFYGITYKENINDIRESPTLQILESMRKHLAFGVRIYDPFVREFLGENQYFHLDEFLEGLDLVIIMVAHKEIIENMEKLQGKIIFDTKNCCGLFQTYKL